MPADLRKIPGVESKRRRSWPPRHDDVISAFAPPAPALARGRARWKDWRIARRPVLTRRREPIPWSSILTTVGCVALGIYLINAFWGATRVDVAAEGLPHQASVTSRSLAGVEVRFVVDPGDRMERAALRLDGAPVPDKSFELKGSTLHWRPGKLPEGEHKVSLSVPRLVLSDASFGWQFTVDDTPPRLDVPALLPAVGICDAVTVQGRTEPGAKLTLDGKGLDTKDGRFSVRYDRPPTAPLHFGATDAAGNTTEREVIVPVGYPGAQGVHVTAAAWGYEPLRQGIVALMDARLISTVELDLKDEAGVVGYDSQVPLAHRIGAVAPEYRLKETVAQLKSRGIRVIGRIVAFRDEPLANWAWENGKRDWVVQTVDGGKNSAYGGFTNPGHPEVHRYNLDIALEATAAGVDDILWDYVRRPEGDPATMVFPGMRGSPADAVVEFLATSRVALRQKCAFQGAAVFGIAADRPDAVGQDVPRIARHVEYVAPMLYPSHWVKGEYGVDNPNAQPYDIIKATLADFQAKVAGTGAALVPWLQDFTLGFPYGPAEVRAQIRAAADLGVNDWLLWNAGAEYTGAALQTSSVGIRAGAPRP